MIGRMCKVGDGLSRPVLIARKTFVEKREIYAERKAICFLFCHPECYSVNLSASEGTILSSPICRGYSGEEPPLPIPNREVKLTRADGTDPPVGRVGRRGFSKA